MSGSQSGGSERDVLLFMRDSQSALSKICQNILLKCPLKYPSVRNMMCLDPQNMHKEPDMCLQKIKALIMKFVQDKKLSGGVTAGNICRHIRNVNNKPSVYQRESYFRYQVILAYYFAVHFFLVVFYFIGNTV